MWLDVEAHQKWKLAKDRQDKRDHVPIQVYFEYQLRAEQAAPTMSWNWMNMRQAMNDSVVLEFFLTAINERCAGLSREGTREQRWAAIQTVLQDEAAVHFQISAGPRKEWMTPEAFAKVEAQHAMAKEGATLCETTAKTDMVW